MPELPEVETTRRLIEPQLTGARVLRVEHAHPERYLRTAAIEGRTVSELARRGKYILVRFHEREPALELIVHLGMTGGFRPQGGPHTRVTLHTDRGPLFFNDARRFGKWLVVPEGDYRELPTLAAMGPEPLSDDFSLAEFVRAARSAGAVKPWLLSQKPVAGLGNIYADEALWRAGIHPETRGLDEAQATRLHAAIREVLARAVEVGGSTLSDNTYQQPDGKPGYFQLEHSVYARERQPCPRCGTEIRKYWLAQRGTHYCPTCQAAP
ncbi:formamidopyrimidine-DNA glycosylase [Deinobacterium chartae]|uniref:Formamidopyrimidine-DNA glycosylase n=1 Tax=Deinobacterium chartae TaxID=521158 RepID=A0A841HX13_9DEIO|nr:formamidopyrimidine-DNA glycosylase [Deinobacterium chartae]